MKSNLYLKTALPVLFGLVVGGCGGGLATPSEPTPIPPVVGDIQVNVEGRLIPADFVQLAFQGTGEITEVLIQEGDLVQVGQVLARLDFFGNRETLEAAVSAAELELASARLALDDLRENNAMLAAQTQFDLANSRDALKDAEYKRSVQQEGRRASSDSINAAEANLILAENEVDRAQKEYNKYSGRREDDPRRALALSNLSAARQNRDAILRQLNWMKGSPSDIDQAMLDAEVAVAQARVDELQQQWEILQLGPDPDDLALAEARVANAQAQLDAAESSLADFENQIPELTAPIDGKVVSLNLKIGETAVPGQTAVVIADFSNWMVETDDLTEIEVVEISVGQEVKVIPDSLPDLVLTGKVHAISDIFEEKRGDITYTTEIMVDEIDPRLRWGMTVLVEFENP